MFNNNNVKVTYHFRPEYSHKNIFYDFLRTVGECRPLGNSGVINQYQYSPLHWQEFLYSLIGIISGADKVFSVLMDRA